MFSQLLSQLQGTIQQAKETIQVSDSNIKEHKRQFSQQEKCFHNPTQKFGKTNSFTKSQRFKPLVKQEPKTTDGAFDSNFPTSSQQINKAPSFAKSTRFQQDKIQQKTIINPNYDLVKRNNKQAPLIKQKYYSDLQKSRLSQATQASFSDVGPAAYFIKQQEKVKVPAFPKAERFTKVKKTYEDVPLNIQETQTKKRPPSAAVLRKKQKKTKNIISKEEQEETRQRLKMVYWKSIPLELDRLFKRNNGPLLKEKYFDIKKLKGVERRCAVMMLLERMNFERGGLDINVQKKLDNACGAVYRKSTPKPFKFSQIEPGPDYYYPQDDIIRLKPIVFTFNKREEPKKPKVDNRDYEINEDLMKKGGNIVINPEHVPHRLTEQEIRSLNRGPGFYDCLFSQVQKRNDVGLVSYQPINEKNARQNNCVQTKQTTEAVYYPSYKQIDKNVNVPLLKEPLNVKPIHTPDKELFPEHWLFYDGDLNKVRAEIAKNVFVANSMPFDEYQRYVKRLQAFKKYLKDQQKMPQALEYDVKYDGLDPHIQGFDMKKKEQKTLIEPIVKEEGAVDGDNLLLEPEKLKEKLPNINFNKMVGRQENQLPDDEAREGDILLINPQKPEKKIGDIVFEKMKGRPEGKEKNIDEEPEEGDRVILYPKEPEKHIQTIDFNKQSRRPEIKNEVEDGDGQEMIIDPNLPKKIKGFVDMKRMSSVKLVPYLKKNRERICQQIEKEEDNQG